MLLGVFGLGGWEVVMVLAIILILFGAKALPPLVRGLGQGIDEFRSVTLAKVQEKLSSLSATEERRLPEIIAAAPVFLDTELG